jgi:hypothetical protein
MGQFAWLRQTPPREATLERSSTVLQRPHSATSRRAAAKMLFITAALVSFLLSVTLFFLADDQTQGIFVGLWVPSILSLGTFLLAGERVR